MLKNVVIMLKHPDGDREPVVIGVPGDREVDMKRLEAQVGPAVPEAFTDEDFAAHPQLVRGYIGPQALGEASPSGIRYLVDPRVVDGTRWITGANLFGRHVYDLVAGRDFVPDGTIEAAEVRAGDACPRCDGVLELARGIEIGHIFQLGRKYADALDLKVLDQNGKLVTVTMGSYGIGVSRAVAAIAEQSHDELGLIWPREVAPADVHLIATGKKDDVVFDVGARLAGELEAAGVRVLYDDRQGVSPGVKFADSELIGVPTIVVAGRRLADGVIEVKDRRTGERTDVPIDDAVSHLTELVAAG
jgi:prolyl-tRNA synthetase